ncbi:MAG: hypothetical protein PWR02_705 [Synergistales bacterium]|jgi:isocitrate/isopropylmalate dehydrogenase|nr:hypothetical protein [Synergistales bacterium]
MARKNVMQVKEKKDHYQVAYIPGDDSGFDVMEAAMIVMQALNPPIDWVRADMGWCMWEKSCKEYPEGDPRRNTVPPETIEKVKNTDATLMAAITSKSGVKGFKSAILQLRQIFDLYINFRPAKLYPGISTPLKGDPNIDIAVFRENTEDLYSAVEWRPLPKEMFDLHPGMERFKDKEEVAVSWRVFSKEGCDRIIRAAFEYAKANGLTSVVSCNKANVIRATDGLMKERFLEIAKEYPEIEAREENADATAMWLLKNPENYQVIVTSNVFGDILSDEASQLIGGLGFSPSGNIGENAAVFEPSHGSVPKYAHQYKINPCGLLITAAMMLNYLQLGEYAEKLEKAIGDVLVEGKALTYDIWRDRGDKDWETKAVSTLDMAKAIAAKLDPDFNKKADEICAKAKEMCAWEHLV